MHGRASCLGGGKVPFREQNVKCSGFRLPSRPIQLCRRVPTSTCVLPRATCIAFFALFVTLLAFPAAGFTATDTLHVVTIQSALLDHPLVAGGASRLVVSASILPGWHINSNHPLGEYYIPTQLTVKVPPVATAGAVTYPPAREVSLKFAAGEKLSVFNGNIQFAVPIKADTAFKADVGAPATVRIDYQACNDDQCLRPTSVDYKTDLASSGAPAGLVAIKPTLRALTIKPTATLHGRLRTSSHVTVAFSAFSLFCSAASPST